MITVVLVVASVLIWFWPNIDQLVAEQASPQVLKKYGFRRSIDSLSYVRGRLLECGQLSDPQKQAIDVLTLALVAGSDKE